jgi:iron-sulfur cluster assembly protein
METPSKKYLGNKEETSFLRIGITTTGCSGYMYQVSTSDSKGENDIELNSNGIKILTDKLNYRYLEGLLIDFKKDGINEGFSFQNPNADATCGCGESFSIDSDNA